MRSRSFPMMISQLAFIASCLAHVHAAHGESFQVPPELWDRPRTGQVVLAVPAIRQSVNALLASPQAKLAVRHPPGVESAALAEELRAWLVAHAVEPARILVRADLQARQAMQLDVLN